jgi:L-alanine-DL-glutamate epimerase-like enolase superfamily enzyme
MTRRNLLAMSGTAGLTRGLAVAAEAKKQIKITGIETDLLRLPPTPYEGDAIHDFGEARGGVVLRVLTNAGITGWGYSTFGMIAGAPRVVQTILKHEIKPVLIGQDPAFPKRIRADLWRALEYQGVQGITQFAMSVVDIAVWDILGKAAGLPVYKMLGAVRDRMPAYAMCGWYRQNDRDHSQYKQTINETLEMGYRAFKVKVGRFGLFVGRRVSTSFGRGQQLLPESVGQHRELLVDLLQLRLIRIREVRACVRKAGVGQLDQPLRFGVERKRVPILVDGLDTRKELRIEHHRVRQRR